MSENPNLEIQKILQALNHPGINNEPVLGVNVIEMQRGRNNGYPLHMYHQTLDAVIVLNREQERALSERGYVRNYIPKPYPKFKHRRNMDPRFAERLSIQTGEPENVAWVESRIVQTKEAEDALLKQRIPAGCSAWFDTLGELPPLPDNDEESAVLAIARLEGQLAEARAASASQQPESKAVFKK